MSSLPSQRVDARKVRAKPNVGSAATSFSSGPYPVRPQLPKLAPTATLLSRARFCHRFSEADLHTQLVHARATVVSRLLRSSQVHAQSARRPSQNRPARLTTFPDSG